MVARRPDPVVIDLPGWRDPLSLLARARGRGRAALLHSAGTHPEAGRFTILAAEPYMTVSWRGRSARVEGPDGLERFRASDPFGLLDALASRHRCAAVRPWPFAGGAIGFFAYDAGRAVEALPVKAADDRPFPWMDFAFYAWAIGWDHLRRRWAALAAGAPHITAARACREAAAWALAGGKEPARHGAAARLRGAARESMGRAAYLAAVRRIRRHIEHGDCYEVNLTRRITRQGDVEPVGLFHALAASNPAPFSAYIEGSRGILVGSSPERFLQVAGGRAESRPIKGTAARSGDAGRDRAAARDLASSEKNRAENVMIVDLTRNDLGRVCAPGSVRVDGLCNLESFEGVHHLVSTVSGRLEAGAGPMDAARALFPPGSMTGAPKIRAMEIIEAIEPVRRGPYAGAAGYLSAAGTADLSVVIRSLLLSGRKLDLQVGGAVVADSDPAAEYEETRVKADRALLAIAAAGPPAEAVSGERRPLEGGSPRTRRSRDPRGGRARRRSVR